MTKKRQSFLISRQSSLTRACPELAEGGFGGSLVSLLLDILYPPSCVHCGAKESPSHSARETRWWCEKCQNDAECLKRDPCPRCLTEHSETACRGGLPFDGIVACGYYHSPPLRRAIASIKYQGMTALASDLESFLRQYRQSRSEPFPWAQEPSLHIFPMPLALSRERERGFNQAKWLAERMRIAWNISAPFADQDLLTRSALLSPQAEIDEPSIRATNVAGSFAVHGLAPEAILLVDDVVTTGSTAKEAALCLKKGGTKRIYMACLALGR